MTSDLDFTLIEEVRRPAFCALPGSRCDGTQDTPPVGIRVGVRPPSPPGQRLAVTATAFRISQTQVPEAFSRDHDDQTRTWDSIALF